MRIDRFQLENCDFFAKIYNFYHFFHSKNLIKMQKYRKQNFAKNFRKKNLKIPQKKIAKILRKKKSQKNCDKLKKFAKITIFFREKNCKKFAKENRKRFANNN